MLLTQEDFTDEPPLPVKEVVHQDVVIAPHTSRRAIPPSAIHEAHVLAHFDGGAAKAQGVGGFIVWDAEGHVVAAHARFYGSTNSTNNAAEVAALVDLMEWLATHFSRVCNKLRVKWVVIKGDSKLIIDFCNRVARPGESHLYLAIAEVRK